MANTQLSDTPWLDILPPPAPVDHTLWYWLLIIGIAVLVLVVLFVIWQRQPRQRALRQLHHLQQQCRQTGQDNKQCLYQLNRLLCQGLQLHQLGAYQPAATESRAWQTFYQRLLSRQYPPSRPDNHETQQLLDDAGHWLKKGSGR